MLTTMWWRPHTLIPPCWLHCWAPRLGEMNKRPREDDVGSGRRRARVTLFLDHTAPPVAAVPRAWGNSLDTTTARQDRRPDQESSH